MPMVLNMQVNGKKIYSMVKEQKNGQTVLFTMEIINWEKNMEMEHLFGRMGQHIPEILKTITFKVMVIIHGLTKENLKETGQIIKCTVKEYLLGTMVKNTQVHMLMTKKKGTESSNGPMADVTKVDGKMENNMVQVNI